tara:strand:- start:1951 stop:2823 length:873 start_codon:yes stop_codon:yes gene_type:complete
MIPYYSSFRQLTKAVESVLSQTSSDWLLTIVNDNPLACNRIDSYLVAINDKRVTCLHNNKNIGITANWNKCIKSATSELVTIFHSDDILDKEYVYKMEQLAKKHPKHRAYFCNANIIDEFDRPVFSFPDFIKSIIRPKTSENLIVEGDAGLASLLKGNYIFCPTVCYRISGKRPILFSKQWQMVQDLALYKEILIQGESLLGCNDKLYNYRRHNNSQTSILTKNHLRFIEEKALYKDIYSASLKLQWHKSSATAKRQLIIQLNLFYQVIANFGRGDFKSSYVLLKLAFTK